MHPKAPAHPALHPLGGRAGRPWGTQVPQPPQMPAHTQSARKTAHKAEVLNGRETAGEMETNSLSSFVPTEHSRKEQAALLKERKKSNNTKSYYKLPGGSACCSPLPSPRAHRGAQRTGGCSRPRAQATQADTALEENGFPRPATPG